MANYSFCPSLLDRDHDVITTFQRSMLPPPPAARTIEFLVSYHNTIQCQDPEDLDLKHHHCESLKTRILFVLAYE